MKRKETGMWEQGSWKDQGGSALVRNAQVGKEWIKRLFAKAAYEKEVRKKLNKWQIREERMERDGAGMIENYYGDDYRKKGRGARKRGQTLEGCKEGNPLFPACLKWLLQQIDSHSNRHIQQWWNHLSMHDWMRIIITLTDAALNV